MIKLAMLGAYALFGLTPTALADSKPITPDVPAVSKPAQREGYFFVGGRYETVGGKELATGQMFVQRQHTPPRVRSPDRTA